MKGQDRRNFFAFGYDMLNKDMIVYFLKYRIKAEFL